MNVICLEEEAFFQLVESTLLRLQTNSNSQQDLWIGDEEAMRMLHIKSKTTLQKLRDTGSIRFSQPLHKVILYDRESILKYIEQNVVSYGKNDASKGI